MASQESSAGEAPSADTLKERMDKLGAESNLGAGQDEPDPATAENPPRDTQQGDRERDPD